MDLKEKLDRQISRAVRDAVIQLSRDEVPDAGNLALAIASGTSADDLVKQAKEKTERRSEATKASQPKAPAKTEPAKPANPQPAAPFVHPLTTNPAAPPSEAVGPTKEVKNG